MADDSASKRERWQRTDKLLDSALAQPPETRAAFLAQACGDDESLRRDVESLLKHHALAENFLENSPGAIAADMFDIGEARLKQGQLVDHYKILSLLGVGGMGDVYLAQDTRLGRQVALKMLPAQFSKDEERAHRFVQEARAASALNHPNIVVIHQIGQVAEQLHIVTEFIDGQTLRVRLAGTPLRLAETLDIAVQVAGALDAAHRAGIVHRDIKPENIMLRPDGVVKVLDFGLAKLIDVQGTAHDSNAATKGDFKTGAGMVMGTAQYMSPEQVRGQKIDARTDIWSLGVVIYEMITNVAPFGGETPNHAIVAVLEKEPQPLTRHSEGAPAELERIVYKALQKNREERYQTIKDLALDLKNLKQELEVEARLRRSAGQHANDPVAGVKRAVKTDSRTAISSAEYVAREIKSRMRGVLVFLAALVIAAAAIAYFIQGGTPIESAEDSRLDYLQGLGLFRQQGDESHERAREFFESAITKDKNNALALAGLSDYYGLAGNLGVLEPNKAWPLAEKYAGKAAAIDAARGEDHGEVHEALGVVRMYYHRDWPGAESEFITALKLAPDFRDTYQPYLRLLRVMGRFQEALDRGKDASEADSDVYLARTGPPTAIIYYLQGHYDQAIEELKKLPDKNANSGEAITLWLLYAKKRMFKECLATIGPAEISARTNPTGRARPLAAVGYVYAACGDKAKARQILEDVMSKRSKWHNLSYSIAAIHTALEEKDEAFKWLQQAVDEHTHDIIELKTDPRFEPLRQDPRFPGMLGLLKLAPTK